MGFTVVCLPNEEFDQSGFDTKAEGKKYIEALVCNDCLNDIKMGYVELDAVAGRECLDFADGWCIARDCDGVEGLRHERAAIDDMISHWNTFGLVGELS